MSVVAYRDGVMAADTKAWLDWKTPSPGQKTKIRRLKNGTLIGCVSSEPGTGELLMDWYEAGADPSQPPGFLSDDFTLLVVRPDGEAMIYMDRLYPTGPIEAPYFAVGSGDEVALGAMFRGATAEEGVEAACHHIGTCALPVKTIRHIP